MSPSFRFVILGGLLLAAVSTQAQMKLPPRRTGAAPRPRSAATAGVGMKDGLALVNGRVVLTELGLVNPLTGDKKLLNGYIVSPTGLVTAPGGTTTQMAEGDVASLTGRVTTRILIAEQDSLLKIKQYDIKYPGKRKKMEEARERKEKEKEKRAEATEKAKAKREKSRR